MSVQKYDFENPREGIIDFLSSNINVQYFIPVFQRNYVWSIKQVKQFIDDLERIVRENEESKQIHYLGTIIHKPNNVTDSPGRSENQIVDGQQRLTTTFLVLYAIKNLIKKLGDIEYANSIEKVVLTNAGSPEKYKLKLKPSIAQDDTYKKIVEDRIDDIQGEEEESSVIKNYKYIEEEISNRSNNKLNIIKEFYTALGNFYIVPIKLKQNENVQKIFESINATGKVLSQSDLIRNYVMMQKTKDEEQVTLYNDYWRKIEKNTNNDEDETAKFFRQFIAIKEFVLISRGNVYEEFKMWYDNEKANRSQQEIMNEVLMYSTIYYKLLFDDNITEKQIKLYRRIDSDMPLSLLMFVSKQYFCDKAFDVNVFNNCIKVVNTYLIRRGICNIPTNSISSMFPTILKNYILAYNKGNIEPEKELVKLIVISNRLNKKNLPNDDEVLKCLKEKDLYNDGKAKSYLNVFFKDYESSGGGVIPKFLEETSIEHIMPQNGRKWLKDSDCISIEEYEKYNFRLGNLTLLLSADNSRAKNNIFVKKKEIFENTSNFKLNIEIIKKQSWGKKEIEERTERLAQYFITSYPDYNGAIDYEEEDLVDIKIDTEGNKNKCMISAFLNVKTGVVTIKEGSYFLHRKDWCDDKLEDIYNSLIEQEVLKKITNKVVFDTDYDFVPEKENETALSLSAKFILNYSVNGKDRWRDIDNNLIKENAMFINSRFGR